MLEVLDVLKGYAVLETDHFVLKFDRGQDEMLARYASKFLEEEAYPQLVQQYGFKPDGKTLFEIFRSPSLRLRFHQCASHSRRSTGRDSRIAFTCAAFLRK